MMQENFETPAEQGTYFEVQQFLFREARLLDDREYRLWMALLTDDIGYRVSLQVMRDAEASRVSYAIIDEDLVSLTARVDQICNPRLTRAENPPTLTRRIVSNLEVFTWGDEYIALTNLVAHRTRGSVLEGGTYVGRRRDVLRRTPGGLRLAARDVRLDQSVLFDGALSTIL